MEVIFRRETHETGGELGGNGKKLCLVSIDHGLHAVVQNVEIGFFGQLQESLTRT